MRKNEKFYRKCDFCGTDIHYGQPVLSLETLNLSYVSAQGKWGSYLLGILCSKCGDCINDPKSLRKAIGVSEPAPEHVGNCYSLKPEELVHILDTCGECGTVIRVHETLISFSRTIWKTKWDPVFGNVSKVVGRETVVSYCSGCGPKMVDESRLLPLIVKKLIFSSEFGLRARRAIQVYRALCHPSVG